MHNPNIALMAVQIKAGADAARQRTGQYLFNHLPEQIAYRISGMLFDPFHRDMTQESLIQWIDEYLMFDGNRIIAAFNGDKWIWTEDEGE